MADGWSVRPFRPADAAAAAALLNDEAARRGRAGRAVVDGAGNIRMNRYVPPASQQAVASAPDGALVGYMYLADRGQGVVWEAGGAVSPGWERRGIGGALLGWAERQAAERERYAPAGVALVLQLNLFEDELAAIGLAERRGYAWVREWLHMERVFAAPPVAAPPPPGIAIRPMDLDEDWGLAGPAMDAAFADHWGAISEPLSPAEEPPPAPEPPADDSYSNAPGLCFLAFDGPACVGGILCNAKLAAPPASAQPGAGRIGSVFVVPGYRRRGLGRALMETAFAAFWQRGARHVILDTDAASLTSAPAFYQSVGMAPYRRERLYEKPLRPGREARRLG